MPSKPFIALVVCLLVAGAAVAQTQEDVKAGLTGAGRTFTPISQQMSRLTAQQSDAIATAQNDCNALLKGGVFDHIRVRKASDLRLAIDEWMCTTEFRTHDEAINAGLSVGFPVYGVPLTIGGTFSNTERETWKKTHCQTKQVKFSDQEQYEFDQLIASKPLLETYTRCIESTSFGVQSTLMADDNCKFALRARYIPNSQGDKEPTIQTTTRIEGAVCPGLPPPKDGKLKVPYGGVTFNCRRNEREAVLITLNTTKGTRIEKLAALPDRPPRPKEPVYEDRWFDSSEDGRPYVYDCVVSSATISRTRRAERHATREADRVLRNVVGVPCGVCSVPPGTQYTGVQYICQGNCGWLTVRN